MIRRIFDETKKEHGSKLSCDEAVKACYPRSTAYPFA